MKQLSDTLPADHKELTFNREEDVSVMLPDVVPASARQALARMFRDPYLLKKEERVDLVLHLREAVALEPAMPELRILLGMALCVNFDGQAALEELREAARLAPDHFAARLKFGELLMRLRVCDQAMVETEAAAMLAANPLQSELARRQAATIRIMQRAGVESGGYRKFRSAFDRIGRLFPRAERKTAAVALHPR